MSSTAAAHTYKQAGVDIHEAASLVDDIGVLVKRTQRNRKLANPFGLFAAAYDLSAYKHPIILTGCDGVGTKIELLLKHRSDSVPGLCGHPEDPKNADHAHHRRYDRLPRGLRLHPRRR